MYSCFTLQTYSGDKRLLPTAWHKEKVGCTDTNPLLYARKDKKIRILRAFGKFQGNFFSQLPHRKPKEKGDYKGLSQKDLWVWHLSKGVNPYKIYNGSLDS